MKFIVRQRLKFNPYHDPATGQFTSADGTGTGKPGSFPIQHIDFNKLMASLPAPKKVPLNPAIEHDLNQWVDLPMDYMNLWERARDRKPEEMQNAWQRLKYIIKIKFNPNHDPANGKFTSADHSVDSPDQLLSYMHTLADAKYHPNIANLKVGGRAILHPEKSLGLKREEMPQIPTAARDGFLNSMRTSLVELDPRTVYPTQSQIDGHKTALFMKQSMEDTDKFRPPIVSSDHYVIDGHHNWASRVVQAEANPSANVMMLTHLVDMPRDRLLARARSYADAHGFESKTISKFNPNHVPAGSPEGGEFASNDVVVANALGPFTQYTSSTTGLSYTETPAAHALNDKIYKEHSKWFYENPKIADDVADYMTTAYDPLNNYLRTGVARGQMMSMDPTDAKSMAARLERGLDEAPELPDGTTLYRSFRSDRIVERAAAGDLEGRTFQDKAFLSTTSNPFIASIFADKATPDNTVVMRITTHDGVRGLYTPAVLHADSYRPGEYEVLLNKSTPLEISKVTRLSSGTFIVDANVYGERAYKFNPNHDPSNGKFASGDAGGRLNDIDGDGQGDLGFMQGPAKVWGAEYDLDQLDMENPNPNKIHDALVSEHFDYRQKLPWEAGGNALNEYQGGHYRPINGFLANTNDKMELTPQAKQAISDAAEKDWSEGEYTPEQIQKEAIQLDKALDGAPALANGIQLFRAFRSVDLNAEGTKLVGQVYRDPRFLSTSANGERVNQWITDRAGDAADTVVMRLTTKDAHGLYLTSGPFDRSAYEHEILFDRNTPIRVTGVRPLIAYGQPAGMVIEGTIGHG